MTHALMVLNDIAWFWSHRLPLAEEIQKQGWKLSLATAGAERDVNLKALGVSGYDLPEHDNGLNPFRHLAIVWSLYKIVRDTQPDIIHAITLRHAFYVGLIARLTGYKPVIFTIAGLGSVFAGKNGKAKLIRTLAAPLFKFAFGGKGRFMIFQNPDDRAAMVDAGIVKLEDTGLIRGSGVDLEEFSCSPIPEGTPVILFPSRLIREKGIYEFIDAARLMKAEGKNIRFQVAGHIYEKNPHSVSSVQMKSWADEGIVEWLGQASDMPEIYKAATIVTLPSYYGEGVPKVLLEAMAVGRPIITTDWPGCREAVVNGENGLLIPVKDSLALVEAIENLLKNPMDMALMGQAGRRMAEADFGVGGVVEKTLAVYRRMLAG